MRRSFSWCGRKFVSGTGSARIQDVRVDLHPASARSAVRTRSVFVFDMFTFLVVVLFVLFFVRNSVWVCRGMLDAPHTPD